MEEEEKQCGGKGDWLYNNIKSISRRESKISKGNYLSTDYFVCIFICTVIEGAVPNPFCPLSSYRVG